MSETVAAKNTGSPVQSGSPEPEIPGQIETNPGPATPENVEPIEAVPSIVKPRTLVLPLSEIAGRQLFKLRPASLPPRPEIQETEPAERQDSQNSEFARESEDPQLFELRPASLPPRPEVQETEQTEKQDSQNSESARDSEPLRTQQIVTRVQ
ncbi:hypothetical protein MMC09_007085 [Bachmanniomyces sp. S44760]|nr:hypothetical protein [Bachmanniomyces sp. S44760]